MSGIGKAERPGGGGLRDLGRPIRLSRRGWRVGAETKGLIAVVVIVLLANLPYLVGLTDSNPLGPRSLLGADTPGFINGANTLDPNDGYVSQSQGHLAATDLLHGRLPWWDPYEGAGAPLLAEGQAAALFPPTLLLALPNGQFYEQLLLELVAGLSTFLLLRRLGLRRAAAVAGAAAFALNGTFTWLANAPFNPVAFLPLLLLGLELARDAAGAGRRGGWWLVSIAVALSLYAGFPETAYIDGLFALAWLVWRCFDLNCWHRARRMLIKAIFGVIGGVLIAAPMLIPFLTALSRENVGIHNGLESGMHLPGLALPQMLLPYVYGPPLAFADPAGQLGNIWGRVGGFLGFSLVLLGLLGLFLPRRRAVKTWLAVWVLLALSRMYGVPLLGGVFGVLPRMSSVAFYRYAYPSVEFSFALLAASGIDEVADWTGSRKRLAGVLVGALVLLGLAVWQAHGLVIQLSGGSGHSHWAWASIGWALVILLIAEALLLFRPRWIAWGLAALLVADSGAMFGLHELSAPRQVHLDRTPVTYLQRHLGNQRFFTLGPIQPEYGAYWRIGSVNDDDVPVPNRWVAFVHERLDPVVNPLVFVGNDGGGRLSSVPTPAQQLIRYVNGYRAAGVSYVVTPPGVTLPRRDGFQLALRNPGAWIYRLAGVTPYFSTSGGCTETSEGRLRVGISCRRPAVLVRRELFFPGWSARIDGHAVRLSSDGAFQQVRVPNGRHTVTFAYIPPHIVWALVALLAGVVWVLFGVGAPARVYAPRRRDRASEPAPITDGPRS